MKNVRNVGVLLLLLVIGPVMFVVSRSHSLSGAFDRVNIGDAADKVFTTMGPPQEKTTTNLYLHGDTEYRYSVWPAPQLWVVSLKDGKVVEKAEMKAR